MVIEISFPRGGRKPPPTFKAPKARREYELFGSKKKEKPKNKEKKGPKERDTSVIHEDIEATSAQLLTYMSIQNDMVLLGCVREIQRMAIGLSLPGRLSGRVMITKLSESYTQILHSIVGNTEPEEYRSLKQLFKPGQCVACKVITIQSNDDKCRIDLSMMPQDVNSQLSHTNIATGMLLWCAIQSVEEHVYVIDSGIKHCRAFLPKSNLDEDKKLAIGELQWCIVQKCDISPTATTVHLNALTKRVTNTKITKDTSLDHILPGMQVDVTISKILSDGLECKFLNDYTGYICESQLSRVLDKPKFYKIGQIFQARVMYIMPVTKLTFLTFRSLEPYERGDLRDGTLLSCKVLSNTNSGLYLNLGKNQKGYVSYRRLQTELPINSELEDSDIVKRKYPRGSTHQCRILSFDYLDRVYICTLEKDLLKEKVFSYSDLQLGEEVTVEIKEIQPRGLLVEIGRLTGYIQNNQISDMILKSYANIKSKFHNGQKIKAKVFAINEETNSLLFTIKPSFMNSKENLINYDQAELYKQFPGIIKQIYSHGLLVSFFGEVKGWVPKALMSFENIQNPAEVFQIGQMVKCTVLDYHKNSKKLTLSLRPPVEKPDKQKKISENNSKSDEDKVIGRHVGVTVTNVTQLGLEVKINNSTNFAFIPTQQLTKFPSLANLLLDTYKEGDEISDLVYTNNKILSLRDAAQINEKNIPEFTKLKPHTLLNCSVYTANNKGVLLQMPIKKFKRLVSVNPQNVCENAMVTDLDIVKNQSLIAKVLTVDSEKQEVTASTKLYDCWNCDLNVSISLLSDYLSDIQRIQNHWKSQEKPLAKLNLGEQVSGIVKEKTDTGCYIVSLSNGALAKVQPEHSKVKGELVVGSEIKGVVLWLNFEKDFAEITLSSKLMDRINRKQSGNLITIENISKEKHHAEILLVYSDFVLVALRGKDNKRQLAFLPTRLHVNDLVPNLTYYTVGSLVKVELSRVENEKILGVLEQLIKDIFIRAKSCLKRVRKLSNSSVDSVEPNKKRARKNRNKKKSNQNGVENIEMKCDEENAMEVDTQEENKVPEGKKSKKQKKKDKKLKDVIFEAENLTSIDDNEIKPEPEDVEEDVPELQEESSKQKNKEDKNRKEVVLDVDSEDENEEKQEIKIEIKEEDDEAALPGANYFWTISEPTKEGEVSSGEETEEPETKKQKKKKLTPAERAEAARVEEERIRRIETELADSEAMPKTADQFDRQVLANPNNSLLWINYMAFHLEGTEIEKARAVARRALNTIEFREEQEKLNVWIAFLNLENRYGTKESFSTVLEEAVKMNDALTIYLQALNILSESKKTQEFSELLAIVTRKFKQEFKMWVESAEACYKCDLKEPARHLMQRALKSLDEKLHVNLIVQFAFLESRLGEPERSEALLEKVLASYPRRVDVWTSYVDMLIKGNRIHIARNVLDRAVCQKLPARKMKTIFTKYLQFETKYGDEESVKKVREIAAEYVKTALE